MSETSHEAKRYNRIRIRLKIVDILFVVAYLIIFQFFASRAVKEFSFSITSRSFLALTIYLACFSILHYSIAFPLHLYSGFILEHTFNVSNQRLIDWFKDDVKSGAITFVMFLVFVHILYLFIKIFTVTWWLWMALFWFGVTILLARITPVVILPLFYRYSPVTEDLKEKIVALSEKCGMKVLNVFKIDFSKKTKKINAAVVGLGRTRRVVLADTLVDAFNEKEIAGVLAHEFGHHKLRHMWKMIIFGVTSIILSFFILYSASPHVARMLHAEGIGDIAIFPSLMLILFLAGFLTVPLQNGFSRMLERQADLFSLKVTGDKETFVTLMRKLAEKNLADPDPPRIVKYLFYDHPPISERVQCAQDFTQ